MRIFVTGATGYIGQAVAAALARAGHQVAGLVRSEGKASQLEALEVRPVFGSMADPESYRRVAEASEVLVHCAAELSARQWELDRRTVEGLLEAARAAAKPRLFVYTSGVWVYGDTGGALVDETSPLAPPPLVAARVEIEEVVQAANSGRVRTTVLRPGCVYGGRGGLTATWFDSALREGAARIVGDGFYRWAMVHVEDLAEAYVRAIEWPTGGEVFNITDRSRFTVRECAEAASRAAGADGRVVATPVAEARQSLGGFADCLTLDQHVDARKAVRMLGWQPRHGGFVDGAETYFRAWKALVGRG
ncbi:MAG: NAD-dependent epimerase/dehydratase family protein [Thermoanaerobaculaceae bacterium]|nr:NAD-dependent epimerase/dehydratase family protein [Thermoanaerobaculaceae bacterium]